VVIVDAVHVSHVLSGDTIKNVSSRGLELVHGWCLFRKYHLDVLHLLCAQNVARLTGIRQGRAVGDCRREPGYWNVIAVCNHREIHTDGYWLLALGGLPCW